jgi:hypothetical protein
MAATTVGAKVASAVFGTPTFTGLNVESFEFTEDSQVVDVMDEDGDIVKTAIYGAKVTGSISGTDNGSDEDIADAFTNADLPTGTYFIKSKSISRSNTGFQQATYAFEGAAY